MEHNLDEFIYIKDIELFTLLASFGISVWYGIRSEVDLSNSEEINQNEVLASLYQKGYISLKDNVASVSEELSGILSVLINSKAYIYIRRIQSEIPVLTFYLSENDAVYVERSVNEDNALKLTKLSLDNLKGFILNECFEEDIVPMEADKIYPAKPISYNDEITEQDIYDNEFAAVVEKFNASNGKMTDRLIIQDLGVNYRLYLQSDSSELCMENTAEEWEHILNLLVGN